MKNKLNKRKDSSEQASFLAANQYLNGFIDYERRISYSYKESLKLDRTEYLLGVLNINYSKLNVIHVAGTKGKGSVATLTAYILAACGYRVGLYTSPHFNDFCERIAILKRVNYRVKSRLIEKKRVVEIIERFKPYLEKIRDTKKYGKITFFELYTALAFRYFLDEQLDFVVLEVGLGGRLDATNVVNPMVSVISHIGYDHTNKLGSKISEIAYEKAGIIKRRVPVIASRQEKNALAVIRKMCRLYDSPLFVLGDDFYYRVRKINQEGASFDFRFVGKGLDKLKIRLKGEHQVENASLALAALSVLKNSQRIKGKISFKSGLKQAFIAGRFEVVSKRPLVILDIAHNLSSFRSLAETVRVCFPAKKVILIFAASKDKDVKGMLSIFPWTKIIITRFNNPRSFSPVDIVKRCGLKNALVSKDIREAVKKAFLYYNRDWLVLISGSFFLVAEAKELLRKNGKLSEL
ncbi:MAG: folylpolyglutamate synthase/dihydrofolate synthase family protein [Candidatus Omnitrophota bacterium]